MDRIVETQDGYDCIVGGVRYGTWRSKGEAAAGMATERTRADARMAAEVAREMARLDASVQEYHEWRNRD